MWQIQNGLCYFLKASVGNLIEHQRYETGVFACIIHCS